MKHFIIVLSLAVLLMSYPAIAKNVVTSCDSCNGNHAEIALSASSTVGDYVYVFDNSNRQLKLFYIRRMIDGDWVGSIASERTPSADLVSKAQHVFESRAAYQATIRDVRFDATTVTFSNAQPDISGNFSIAPYMDAMNAPSDCGKGEVTAYDFMTTSSLRKSVFDRMLAWHPEMQSFINTWNRFAQFLNATVVFSSIEGESLAIKQTINFEDGSKLKVRISENGETFDVLDGSAFDCSGNRIPQKTEHFIGNFIFHRIDELEMFKRHGRLFGVDFNHVPFCYSSYQTRCFQTSTGRYTCVYSFCN